MSDDTSATGWHRHDGFNRVHPASDCSVTTPDRIPVLVVDPAEAREKIAEALFAAGLEAPWFYTDAIIAALAGGDL